jgi:uncharacterized protein involved in type VI secretion and phage assembly
MEGGLVETAAQATASDDRPQYGITIAHVIANCDNTQQGRVQVRLPWLPGHQPWARVATAMAGKEQGIYFMPQVGDDDVTDAYVLGSVWNARERSPARTPQTDPVSVRMIKTPHGHQIVFDDEARSITIKCADEHEITLGSSTVTIAMAKDKGSVKLAFRAAHHHRRTGQDLQRDDPGQRQGRRQRRQAVLHSGGTDRPRLSNREAAT